MDRLRTEFGIKAFLKADRISAYSGEDIKRLWIFNKFCTEKSEP